MTNIILLFIHTYKKIFSPTLEYLFGKGCRFNPTCSQYMSDSIILFGLKRGFILSIKRFLKCHPFSGGYYDPVPKKELI